MGKVYIIVLNYNGWQDTIECVESLLKIVYDNFQIIICDNASTDDSMMYIQKWLKGDVKANYAKHKKLKKLVLPYTQKPIQFSKVRYRNNMFLDENIVSDKIILLSCDKNRGFSGGNNVAIKYAFMKNDFTYIWILNNDTVVEPDALRCMVDTFLYYHNIGVTCSTICKYAQPEVIQYIGLDLNKYSFETPRIGKDFPISEINNINLNKIHALNGASFLMHRNFINKVGFLEEKYFLYYEESELAMKAKINGYRIFPCLKSIVYHKEGSSTSKEGSAFSVYHMARSCTIFVWRYYPQRLIYMIIKNIMRSLYHFFRFKYKIAYARLRGIIDGLNKRHG